MVVTIGLNWQQELYVYLYIYIQYTYADMIKYACLLKLVETTGICLSLDICSPHFANLATSLYMPLFSKVWQGAKRIFHDHLMFLSFWNFEESSMQSSHQRGFELLLRYKIRLQLSMAHISAASLRFWRTKCTSWVCFGSDWLQTWPRWPSVNNQRRRFVSGCVCVFFAFALIFCCLRIHTLVSSAQILTTLTALYGCLKWLHSVIHVGHMTCTTGASSYPMAHGS